MKASVFPHRIAPSVDVLAALAVLTLAVCGCSGSKKDPVLSGKVTYKDQPVKGGTVKAFPPDNPKEAIQGNISPEGNYTLAIPAALKDKELKLLVETDSVKQQTQAYKPPPGAPKDIKPPAPPGGFEYVEIPPQYKDPEKTPLKVKVTGGTQHEDLKLTD